MNDILLIHGFPFDRFMWRHQLDALGGRAIAPDLLGTAGNVGPASPDEYSMTRYATDLVDLLDARRIDRAVICGLSMGGYIAFELLRRFPERVRAAILCNTKTAADTPEAKRGRDTMAALAREKGARAVAGELIPKLLAQATREQRPEVEREVVEMIARQPVSGIAGALRALRERPDSTSLLARIQIPMLVIAGENDQITPAAGMREMAGAIAGAKFVLIRGSGHVTPLEQPEAVNAALNDFLAQL